MLGWLTKHLVFTIMSLMMIGVPQEKYQKELDALPTLEQRVAGKDLNGWALRTIHSDATNMTHYYFTYPSPSDSLPVLLCLHGFNTDGRVYMNIDSLSDRYRLIAYNFPERTPLYTGDMADFVRLVQDFAAAMKLDTVALAGNSVGGIIAIQLAATARRPVVSRLVLLSTNVLGVSPDDTKDIQDMADRLMPYPNYKLYYLLSRGGQILGRLHGTTAGESMPTDPIGMRHVDWYRQVMKSLYSYSGVAFAKQVSCPVLALQGAEDRLFPPERAKVIAEMMPQATFEVVAGAGHDLVLKKGPLVARRIRETMAH